MVSSCECITLFNLSDGINYFEYIKYYTMKGIESDSFNEDSRVLHFNVIYYNSQYNMNYKTVDMADECRKHIIFFCIISSHYSKKKFEILFLTLHPEKKTSDIKNFAYILVLLFEITYCK